MPTKTRILDNGNFVYSPEAPNSATFLEYLDYADRLLSEWRKAREAWDRSPLSSELAQRKTELDQVVSRFVDSFRPHYTIKSVKQNPSFWPVSEFFAQYRPLREPFSILHCNLEMPLHTVHAFRNYSDLARINAALDEDTPFPWWQSGPQGRQCYLFGESVWELKESETEQSDEGLVLLFLEMTENRRQNQDKVGYGYSTPTVMPEMDFIPEKVRMLVWRRARGKCAKCASRDGLEFDFIKPIKRGGSAAPDNLQLLCTRCLHEKNGLI